MLAVDENIWKDNIAVRLFEAISVGGGSAEVLGRSVDR